MKKPITLDEHKTKLRELLALLLECRDALPAITMVRAKLYKVRLDLCERIERAMEPWRDKGSDSESATRQSDN